MIRIVKPPKAPKILMTRGVEQTKKDRDAYDANPDSYRSGTQTFHAPPGIYGAKSVKNALLRAQHDKCCYCESKFRPTYYGDVEHYRPKGAVRQAPVRDTEYPGYYWLVYDWNNLLVSCKVCNTSHKGILFPLVDNNTRARNHHDDIGNEQPLFINPTIDDPRDHIRFHEEVPVSDTEIGRVTIEGLGLRRYDLEEDRRTRLKELRILHNGIERLKDSPDLDAQGWVREAREHLAAAMRPEAEYSSMAQDFLGFGV
jgi:uncharacterized protein (TIGR02646 family)